MNEVTFVEAARGLAELMIKKGGTSKKNHYGYRTTDLRTKETLAIMLENSNRRNNQFKRIKKLLNPW